jgi:putative flippase GtrA
MRRVIAQFARFGTVGVTNTVISFVAYAAALRLGVRYLPAGAGAFALGALNGFLLNRAWTFRHRGPALAAGSRYVVVQLVGLVATVALLRLAVQGAGLPRLPAQVAAAVPVTLLCFALSRRWVFGAAPSDAAVAPHPAARPARAPGRDVRRLRDAPGASGSRLAAR